jgi:hypothetical protein
MLQSGRSFTYLINLITLRRSMPRQLTDILLLANVKIGELDNFWRIIYNLFVAIEETKLLQQVSQP